MKEELVNYYCDVCGKKVKQEELRRYQLCTTMIEKLLQQIHT